MMFKDTLKDVAVALTALALAWGKLARRTTRKRAVRKIRWAMGPGYHVKATHVDGDCAVLVYRKAGPHAARKEGRVVIRGKSWQRVQDAFYRMAAAPAVLRMPATPKAAPVRKGAPVLSRVLRAITNPQRALAKRIRKLGLVLKDGKLVQPA